MKKILLASLMFIGITAFAQQPTSNLYLQTGSTPVYAGSSNTGNYLTYGYSEYGLNLAVPASGHDTVKLVTTVTNAEIVFDSINGNHASPLVIMGDSTGDTASYSNYPTGKAKIWYKKNPFLLNHQIDKVTFTFHGNQTSYSTVKFGALFLATGLNAGDTLHIAKYIKTTGAGGARAQFQYDYFLNRWVYLGSITW